MMNSSLLRIRVVSTLLFACWFAGAIADSRPLAAAPPSEPFELRDGDRAVFIGATFLERDQRYGYLETALVSRFPDRNTVFRNLAWSGDTVFGDARSYFDKPEGGFQRLATALEQFQPTVALVGYGWAESWQGEAGLESFSKGLGRLLDLLAQHKARVVLITPPRGESAPPPLPDASAHNAQLDLYSKRLLDIASERGCYTMNLFPLLADEPADSRRLLTDDGVHFTAYGYWRLAPLAVDSLINSPSGASLNAMDTRVARIEIDVHGPAVAREGEGRIAFSYNRMKLPSPPPPADSPPSAAALVPPPPVLAVAGLAAGERYALSIDDHATELTKTGAEWAAGVRLADDPDRAQAERLRATIVKKNELFFHRFRPANETYIFGFRKNEQGRNAVEMPQFDPLVAAEEQAIAALRKPPEHRFVLERVAAKP